MNLGSALIGGFVGTLVLTTTVRIASEVGLTRADIPFLLGTVFTERRTRAKVIGYALHFTIGLLFAFLYHLVFVILGEASWWLGAVFGLLHAMFVGTVGLNILLPAVHPRMGTSLSSADTSPLLEPPGLMMLNYGPSTPVVNVLAHMAYGAAIGYFNGPTP